MDVHVKGARGCLHVTIILDQRVINNVVGVSDEDNTEIDMTIIKKYKMVLSIYCH